MSAKVPALKPKRAGKVTPLEVLTPSRPPDGDAGRLMTSVRALVRRFALSERADTACCGLTVAQAATLEALLVSGPERTALSPCGVGVGPHATNRMGELGRRLGIAPSTLTRNLDRLVEAGLVTRLSDSDDARASRVGLTSSGVVAAEEVVRQEEAFARNILERLPAERRKHVVEALGDLLSAVREATEACCPGAFDHLMTDFPRARSREKEKDDDSRCCE